MLDALSPQRRRVVLSVGALGLAIVLTIVIAVVLQARSRTVDVPQDQLGPVLLVPGYGGTGASLAPLEASLTALGRRVVVVTPEGNGTGDLEAQANHLAEVASSVVRDTGAPSVDVVGYSAGGVVARLWVRNGGAALARRVVTLGSPQHGTTQAALGAELAGGCPPACEQLIPGSDLLRRLNAGDETPDGPRWVTLRSTTDQVVTPVDSAALEGALNLVVQDSCPRSRAAHRDLPTDPVVLAALATVLGPAAPVAPTRVGC